MKWIKAVQVKSGDNIELIEFFDKYSKGKTGLILTWLTNGYGLETRFGKLFIRFTDWVTWDGYDFTPYSNEHYKFLIDEELKENPPFGGGQHTRLDESQEQQGVERPDIFTIVLTSVGVELISFRTRTNKITDDDEKKLTTDITNRIIRKLKESQPHPSVAVEQDEFWQEVVVLAANEKHLTTAVEKLKSKYLLIKK